MHNSLGIKFETIVLGEEEMHNRNKQREQGLFRPWKY